VGLLIVIFRFVTTGRFALLAPFAGFPVLITALRGRNWIGRPKWFYAAYDI
jgi:hypothetical protein